MLKPPLQLFYSYSHADESWLKPVRKYVDQLAMDSPQLIESWADTEIQRMRWEKEIWDRIGSSHLFVPLVTQSFLASTYCRKELSAAIRMAEEEARAGRPGYPLVRPLICGETTYYGSDYRGVQPLLGWQKDLRGADDEAGLNRAYQAIRLDARRLCGLPEIEEPNLATRITTIDPPAPDTWDVLPYYCDRRPQNKTLKDRLRERAGQPLVFIASGTNDALHVGFAIAVGRRLIPEALDTGAPAPPRIIGVQDWQDANQEFEADPGNWKAEGAVTFVSVTIDAADWRGPGPFRAFLKFWKGLGSIAPAKALVLGIFFEYGSGAKSNEEAMKGLLAVESEFRKEFPEVVVLDPFAAVIWPDVNRWSDDLYTMKRCTDLQVAALKRALLAHFPVPDITYPFSAMLDKLQTGLTLIRRNSGNG